LMARNASPREGTILNRIENIETEPQRPGIRYLYFSPS
jgi:hypothetical protein